jgi:hypothetical protein
MRFLPEGELYMETEVCLRFLCGLPSEPPSAAGAAPRRHHLYWRGPFRRKQAFALKSLLATQPIETSEVWLWLDADDGYRGHERSPFLRPLLPFVQARRFDPDSETAGTPVVGCRGLYRGLPPAKRSDLARFVALYKHGGIYTDMDVMFLRDLSPLFADARFADEFCYQWSYRPFANSAVLALRAGSATAQALLARCRERGSCLPRHVLGFEGGPSADLLVLPCAFFDPLWIHHDGKDSYAAAPFPRFEGFFEPVGCDRLAPPSFREFFPGAFTYHWHNGWDAPEVPHSYFGRFERELDDLLHRRLGIEPPGARA